MRFDNDQLTSLHQRPYLLRFAAFIAAVLMTSLVGACTAGPQSLEDPVSRRFTWFSYLNGDDIRSACVTGAPDRYRLVLNASYNEQIRIYEITPLPGEGGMVDARVLGGNLGSINLLDPLADFAGRRELSKLTASDYARLTDAFARDGLDAQPMSFTTLYSAAFYWVGVGCRSGNVVFHAWDGNTAEGFNALGFPSLLFAADKTGVPVNRWRRVFEAGKSVSVPGSVPSEGPSFLLQVRGLEIRK